MSGTIKAIETRYAGYRFRSRLEARWAVFFKEMKLRWHYEPEGYDLDGLNYLPDFWMPELDCFIEIKPDGIHTNEKARRLSEVTGKVVLLVSGPPGIYTDDDYTYLPDYHITVYRAGKAVDYERERDPIAPGGWWLRTPLIFAKLRREPYSWCLINYDSGGNINGARLTFGPYDDGERDPVPDCFGFIEAYDAARSARFEHGECKG